MKTISMSKAANQKKTNVPVIQILIILLLPKNAYAYVDPGSGSVIITTILGLFAAIGFTFRKYFYKLKRLLKGKKPEDDLSDHE
jgi:hypothetical protein